MSSEEESTRRDVDYYCEYGLRRSSRTRKRNYEKFPANTAYSYISSAVKSELEEVQFYEKMVSNFKKKKGSPDFYVPDERPPRVRKQKQSVLFMAQQKWKPPQFKPERVIQLKEEYHDDYFVDQRRGDPIRIINSNHPLRLVKSLSHFGGVYGLSWSPGYQMLCSLSSNGTARIWSTEDWELVMELQDPEEENLEEFYVSVFSPKSKILFVAGKLKERHRWNPVDEDQECIPGPIKVFSLQTGKVMQRLHGQSEEILSIKLIKFQGSDFLVSCGQDGFIFKWWIEFDEDEETVSIPKSSIIKDGSSWIVSGIHFLQNTGNKYFLCACDGGIKLYDFEEECLLQSFPNLYSSYCDCIKFIDYIPPSISGEELKVEDTTPKEENENETLFDDLYFLSRGVEVLDSMNCQEHSEPNKIILHRLSFPKKAGGQFSIESVKEYSDPEKYESNTWVARLASCGAYVVCPTTNGTCVVFNLVTGAISAILSDHEAKMIVRDIIFHPMKKYLLTCAEDGTILVYSGE